MRSRRRLETPVRVLSPPVGSRGFICFAARPPTPHPAQPGGRSHWALEGFLSSGLRQAAQMQSSASRHQVAGHWPRGCQGQGGARKPKRTPGVRGLVRPSGRDPAERGLRASPDPTLFTRDGRLKVTHSWPETISKSLRLET